MFGWIAALANKRPIAIVLVWMTLVIAGYGLGTGVFDRLTDSVATVPGSESDKAAAWLDKAEKPDDSIAAVVAGRSVMDPKLRTSVADALADVRTVKGVTDVPDPFDPRAPKSDDGKALLVAVSFKHGLSEGKLDTAVKQVSERLRDIDAPTVRVAGDLITEPQMNEQAQSDVKNAEFISLPIVLVLLVIIFAGFIAASLPLVVAVVGVGLTFLLLLGASFVTDISVYSIQLSTMLGLGLAIDYALLMVTRFREERAIDPDVPEAVRRTLASAGRTVAFSGVIVAVSLLGLTAFDNPFLRSMGLAGAGVVFIDMLAAVTLLPALLAWFGSRISPAKAKSTHGTFFAAVGRFAAKRPLGTVLMLVIGLGVLVVPTAGITMADADARSLPKSTEARQFYDQVNAHFPAGITSDPVTVIIKNGATAGEFVSRITNLPGVVASSNYTLGDGTLIVKLTPTGTTDGAAATGIVKDVRELRGGDDVRVAGAAARLVDFKQMLGDRLPWAVGFVLIVIGALLFAFTGSVLIPLKTIATTVLSLGASLGVVVWVFQDGHLAWLLGAEGLGALHVTAPPLIIASAFGLAMDYEIFILASMRDSWAHTHDARAAVITGLRRTGRVVTCAALLLIVVFACFMTGSFSPILQIGLGMSLAVLIDATLVRMLLVPATMSLLGRAAWWAPAPLRRLHDRFGISEHPPAPAPVGEVSKKSSDDHAELIANHL